MLSIRRSARPGRDEKDVSREWRVRRSWEEEEQWTTRRRDRHKRNAASSEPAEGELVERARDRGREKNRERERFVFWCNSLSNRCDKNKAQRNAAFNLNMKERLK